ncbi:DUF92 domain-containing protein [Erwinia sp. CPCC 100877]|nr:DUF92 domain-containing protein [Erwinia sp. CPCC 100877]
MTILVYKFIIGGLAGSIIGFFSLINHLLSKSGAAAAGLLGALICGYGPWPTWLLLILFFGSSSCIHLFTRKLNNTAASITAKGHTRDAFQVAANSLPALLCLILFYYTQQALFLIGYVSGIAGATADTWASEIGTLSKTPPRSILTLKKVPSGISGGISLLGLGASLVGSLLIASVFWFIITAFYSSFQLNQVLLIPLICGCANSLIDSLLGATLQVKYRCSVCEAITERRIHHHQPTIKASGISWLTNDWVNFFSGALTILLSSVLYSL